MALRKRPRPDVVARKHKSVQIARSGRGLEIHWITVRMLSTKSAENHADASPDVSALAKAGSRKPPACLLTRA